MCCYKDFKNFERLNNIVQVAMNLAIKFIHTLPQVTFSKKRKKLSFGHDCAAALVKL